MDPTPYLRWLPLFINDLKILELKYHIVHEELHEGNFTVKKICECSMSIHQASEQNKTTTACIENKEIQKN